MIIFGLILKIFLYTILFLGVLGFLSMMWEAFLMSIGKKKQGSFPWWWIFIR